MSRVLVFVVLIVFIDWKVGVRVFRCKVTPNVVETPMYFGPLCSKPDELNKYILLVF